MTGHGRGETARDGFKVTAEISSVNRKQSEISLNLPRELDVLEAPIRDLLNRKIARGRMTVRVALHSSASRASARLHINVAMARAYAQELRKLIRSLKLSGELTLDQLLRAPGVFQTDEDLADAEVIWPAVEKALDTALAGLIQMRQREGAHLARDLSGRVAVMRRCAERIRKQSPQSVERYRQQLAERIKAAGLAQPSQDDERLLREVVLFADRADITEELTRLESHFRQFDDCRKSPEPVGRTLDFLAQEMNREINTIGSKANDSLISREVVALKTELERFREQAQNVE